jgi:hypothetical protein
LGKDINGLANDAKGDAKNGREFASSFASQPKPLKDQENDGDDTNDAKFSTERQGSKFKEGWL